MNCTILRQLHKFIDSLLVSSTYYRFDADFGWLFILGREEEREEKLKVWAVMPVVWTMSFACRLSILTGVVG